MIISRAEFHRRGGDMNFNVSKEEFKLFDVTKLFKEIQSDAAFRNHKFMFESINFKDFDNMPLMESDGIIKKFPDIKTEGDRFRAIQKEIIDDSYEPVPIQSDEDYPDVIYVANGFHRIYLANRMGLKYIRARVMYGKFEYDETITFEQLDSLLDMVSKLFKPESFEKLIEDVKSIINKGNHKNVLLTYATVYSKQRDNPSDNPDKTQETRFVFKKDFGNPYCQNNINNKEGES